MRIVAIDNGTFDTYLGKSDLSGFDVIRLKPDASPATLYNEQLDSYHGWICFVHSDVSCNGLRDAIEDAIDHDDMIYGAVGANNGIKWSRSDKLFDLVTCDSCCIVVNTEWGLRFDDKTFDEYHLYVEDFCLQARDIGIGCSTMYLDAFEGSATFNVDRYFIHHSHTLNKLGCSWGSYAKYKSKLLDKWKDVQTT